MWHIHVLHIVACSLGFSGLDFSLFIWLNYNKILLVFKTSLLGFIIFLWIHLEGATDTGCNHLISVLDS